MPKVKSTLSASLRQWIRPFNEEKEILGTDGKNVTCFACGKDIVCKKKNNVESHCHSAAHTAALHRLERSKLKQATLGCIPTSSTSTFSRDLCEAFMACNIPLWKITNPKMKSFLEKYTTNHVPEESTLRKTYVPMLHSETMTEIAKRIGDNYVYLIVDETTDVRGNYIVHLLIGTLTTQQAGDPFLIASKELEATNGATVSSFVNDTLISFYGGQVFSNRILLLVSDAAPYMRLAGKNLRALYNSMIHVTCVAHALHRICEKVRECFPKVNQLISAARKVFLKCPRRVALYKEHMQCPLPPDVVVTRWGSWLLAVLFYGEHYEQFAALVASLKSSDLKHTQKLKTLIENTPKLPLDIAFIHSYLAFLPDVIEKLETRGLTLGQQLELVENAWSKIDSIPGARGQTLKLKTANVFNKNTGYTILREIHAALVHGTRVPKCISSNKPIMLSSYLYAPITSVDVERSFSQYKLLLSDRRQNFKQSNIEAHIIVQHNTPFLQ